MEPQKPSQQNRIYLGHCPKVAPPQIQTVSHKFETVRKCQIQSEHNITIQLTTTNIFFVFIVLPDIVELIPEEMEMFGKKLIKQD